MIVLQRAPAKYDAIDFKPTASMASAARRGLALRDEHGRGRTAVGVVRARDVANRRNLSPDTVRRTLAFFERFKGAASDQRGTDAWGSSEPSALYIAWLLWGGDPGWSWARARVRQMDAADKAETSRSMAWISRATPTPRSRDEVWRAFITDLHGPAERGLTLAVASYLRESAQRHAVRLARVLEQAPRGFAGEVQRELLSEEDLEKILGVPQEAEALGAATGDQIRGAIFRAFVLAAQGMPVGPIFDPTLDPASILIAEMIQQVTGTTKAAARAIILQGLAEGLSITEIQVRLMLIPEFGRPRARTIARTETTRAVNAGAEFALHQAVSIGVQVRKEWLSARDSAVRESHQRLDGQVVDTGAVFNIDGHKAHYPGDFGIPEEDINCRCTVLPNFPDEA